MLVVISLGGSAVLAPGDRPDVETQKGAVARTVRAVAEIAATHRVVLTHGSGPQVGLLALQAEPVTGWGPYPLDVLGAEDEGLVGYLLEQGLENALPGRDVATLLTQTVVDGSDPAFASPSRPVGPVYSDEEARLLEKERGWVLGPHDGGWRRLVPAPEPVAVVEQRTVRTLVDHDVIVVCAGGGGIPVTVDERGAYRGVEAVVDMDLAAALLARRLRADVLAMLTDVPAVMEGRAGGTRRAVKRAGLDHLRRLGLDPLSMGLKVEACAQFVEDTGGRAVIGSLDDAADLVRGGAGTEVLAGSAPPEYHQD